MSSETRTASCCCGELTMTVRGEPEKVIRCHCDYCQRRTGSVFNVSCWYYDDQVVARTGTGTIFNQGPQNPGIDYVFCPRCGSTVYWEFRGFEPLLEGSKLFGIAVGNFVDASFPAPTLDIHTSYRHPWIHDLAGLEPHPGFPAFDVIAPARAKLP